MRSNPAYTRSLGSIRIRCSIVVRQMSERDKSGAMYVAYTDTNLNCWFFVHCTQHLPIRHSLDPMHCEKNVIHDLLGFILGEKDTVAIRRDMEDIGSPSSPDEPRDPRLQHTPELHLRPIGETGRYFKPQAPYALTTADRGRFINLISSIKTPTGYAGQLGKHIGQKRLAG